MPQIGVRELKNQTAAILRAVREQGAQYVITHRGKPIAVILPVDEAIQAQQAERSIESGKAETDVWATLDELRQTIDQSWCTDKTAVELIAEQRR